nr:hypothetical protein [Melon chlorotic spot virus]
MELVTNQVVIPTEICIIAGFMNAMVFPKSYPEEMWSICINYEIKDSVLSNSFLSSVKEINNVSLTLVIYKNILTSLRLSIDNDPDYSFKLLGKGKDEVLAFLDRRLRQCTTTVN